ncbi:MAG: TIGR01777 family protein [Bdellovibrionales bacterium]|nr:TIGR01777 family protein [Bdellovibrionales bacterium]
MRILISGATGFVGKKLGLELVRLGHELVAIVRDKERARRELPFPCEMIAWGETPENIDAVIHLAGESIAGKRWTKSRKEEILQSRAGTTRALVDLLPMIGGRKPRVMLGASAVGYYGDRGDELLTEESLPSNSFLSDVCRRWEEELFRAEKHCPRVAAFRIGVVLGREGGALREMLPVFKLGFGGPLGSGRQWMSWIHGRDLVGVFLHALGNENVRGVFHAVAPNPVTNLDFTRALARSVRASAFLPVPAFALRLALGEMSELLLSSQRCAAGKLSGYSFQFPYLEKAFQDLCDPVEGRYGRYAEEFVSERWGAPSGSVEKRGIYALWESAEEREPLAGGVLLRRRTVYRLPFGWLSYALAARLAREDVQCRS